jgi:protein-S-isoprenylcysteine O-methyltransferase Ste14
MKFLELRIPPPILALVMVILMSIIASITPSLSFTINGSKILAVFLGLSGFLIIIISIATLIRARTTEDPTDPSKTTTLVVSGIYQYSRNPIYLGAVICLFGFSILLSNIIALLFIPFYIYYLNRFQIAPEERYLLTKFGENFQEYQLRVRRWL